MPRVELKRFTKEEFYKLVSRADSESEDYKFLTNIQYCGDDPYQYLCKHAVEFVGGKIDGVPVYMGSLLKIPKIGYVLSTLIEKDSKHQFTIYKYAKRTVREWARKYKVIYAANDKDNEKVINWIKRMGFVQDRIIYDSIILRMEGKDV